MISFAVLNGAPASIALVPGRHSNSYEENGLAKSAFHLSDSAQFRLSPPLFSVSLTRHDNAKALSGRAGLTFGVLPEQLDIFLPQYRAP
jgi:hypothetical protein